MVSVSSRYSNRGDDNVRDGPELEVSPSTLEVDYDKNITELYAAITSSNWRRAEALCMTHPVQAATWVVRKYEDSEIMWRFLPLHSACARQPPASVVTALLNAYPDASKCVDDQGMLALHYACGNQASGSVIRKLIDAFPRSASMPDPRGMLPLHYLACWGPSDISILDLVLSKTTLNAHDAEGNTPLDLAMDSDYPLKEEVVEKLMKWPTHGHLKKTHHHRRQTSQGSSYTDPLIVTSPQNKKSSTSEISEKNAYNNDPIGASPLYHNRKNSDTSKEQLKQNQHSMVVTETNLSSHSLPSMNSKKPDPNEPASKGVISSSSESTVSSVDRNDKDYLQRKVKEQAMDLKLAQSTIAELREELRKMQQKLQDARSESSGLRVTLGDMMEKHEAIQKRSDETMKRLFSLQISLDSMMEHQNILSSAVKNRNEKMKETSDKRQALFAQLLEIDADTLFEEDKLDASISKQTREMEAIAAVIKAARE
jgi:hypothetical protein